MTERRMLRFWELDSLRGLAVVMMVLYHLLFDLSFFGGRSIDVSSGHWLHFAQATASIFIILVGASLAISHSRTRERGLGHLPGLFRRGLWIFSIGMAITLFTFILFRGETILFGVLHLIGASIVLARPFLSLRYANLISAAAIISLGIYLQGMAFSFPWLLWLGLAPTGFSTLDYFPLLPWFGLVLVGIFLGNELYRGHGRGFHIPDLSSSALISLLSALGRNSLVIYLVHQPLLIMVLCLVGAIPVQDCIPQVHACQDILN